MDYNFYRPLKISMETWVTEKSLRQLQLYGAEYPETEQALNWSGTTQLRERLLAEICALDRQCEQLEEVDGKMDFSLQQTCREMIHSRRVLFRQLGR